MPKTSVLLDLWLVARSRMGYLGLLIRFLPIGSGAAATKYSIFASLSNTPIAYMGILNSYFFEKAGSNAGLYSDAAMGVIGVLVFLLVAVISRKLQERYILRRTVV